MNPSEIRIGVDFGGTKIEAAAIDARGAVVARVRAPNPGGYPAALDTVARLLAEVERTTGPIGRLGVGMPGSVSPRTGLIRGANSVWLNGRPFREDLERRLDRPVRVANDANCLALSEASDGAAAGARVVFGVIVGTGCGGGVVVDGRIVEGANGFAGEWGHTPLPWPTPEEWPLVPCWCGRAGCLETYVSGTGFERDYAASSLPLSSHARSAGEGDREAVEGAHALRVGGEGQDGEAVQGGRLSSHNASGPAIIAAMRTAEPRAVSAFDRYIDRLGRGLAVICDILDPDAIVLGGGMSNVHELYARLPPVVARHVFSDVWESRVVPAAHGDSSGVRGAAWLWPL